MSRTPATRVLRRRRLTSLVTTLLVLGVLPVLALGSTASAAPGGPGTSDPRSAAGSLFTRVAGFEQRARDEAGRPAVVRPTAYAAYRLDLGAARDLLATAPDASTQARSEATAARGLELSVPDPTGVLQRFAVVDDPILEPGLAAAHPDITTYAGRSLDGEPRSIRLDVGPLGLHASVRTLAGGASWYVDPAYVGADPSTYLSYYGAAVPASSEAFVERDLADTEEILDAAPAARTAPGALVSRRTFRMAFATDPTFAAFYGSTDANVLAAKTAIVNRANQVYNDDLAIRFVLIDATDRLNFDTRVEATAPDGPCGADACYDADAFYADGTADDTPDGCTGTLLDENSFVLGQVVGADSFDIGHIGLGVNGGGIAGLGVVGGSSKAQGCTGLPAPTGDFYAVDYFAHEVGHQMGGNHTFNGTRVNCSLTNRNGGTSVEPGSGSSVMAYAGICGQDNLQPHSDPYFSQRSIDEITAVTEAAPASLDEVQSIALQGFDADGDTVQLTYPGRSPVTVTRGTLTYNNLALTTAIQSLTGCLARVSDYHDDGTGLLVSDDGFTITFGPLTCGGTDVGRIGIGTTTGGVTAVAGTLTNGGPETNGGTTAQTANHAPTVSAGPDRTIPLRTPFTLTGSATDVDAGDDGRLVYLWEQDDEGSVSPTGGTALVSPTKTDGPLFRVFGTYADVTADGTLQYSSPGENLATTSGSRTFPDLAQVVAGNTNARTGDCPTPAPAIPTPETGRSNVPVPTVECYAEFLPTAGYGNAVTGRALHFRLTARDLFPTGGGVQHDDVTLSIDNTAGPLAVTSRPAAGTTAVGGASETVTWDVNGTAKATLAPNVRITLSTDGGLTFPTVLAASTANDGTEAVTLPDVSTAQARLRVEAVGNVFFDVNDADFAITGSLGVSNPGPQTVAYSDVVAPVVTGTASGADGSTLSATVTVPGLPGATVVPGTPSAAGVRPGTRTFTVSVPADAAPGSYPVTVTVASTQGAATAAASFVVTVRPEDATATYTGDRAVTATADTTPVTLAATVAEVPDARPGDVQQATVTFVNRGTGAALCTSPVTAGGSASCATALPSTTTTSTYAIGTRVGGRYARDSAADDASLVITRAGAPGPTPGPTPTPTPTPTPVPTVPGGPVATAPAARVMTRTRIRLTKRQVARGTRVPLRTVVTGSRPSTGAAGRAVVRIDGRKARTLASPVGARGAAARTVRLPRTLPVGTHRIRVVFKPADGTYAPSRSRTVVLRVLRAG